MKTWKMNTNGESFLPYLSEFVLAHSSWIYSTHPVQPSTRIWCDKDALLVFKAVQIRIQWVCRDLIILRRIVRIVELATKWLFGVKSRLLDKLYLCLFVCTCHFVTRYLRKAWSWNLKVFYAILKLIELNKLPFFYEVRLFSGILLRILYFIS